MKTDPLNMTIIRDHLNKVLKTVGNHVIALRNKPRTPEMRTQIFELTVISTRTENGIAVSIERDSEYGA
jgi:hypothetical protein